MQNKFVTISNKGKLFERDFGKMPGNRLGTFLGTKEDNKFGHLLECDLKKPTNTQEETKIFPFSPKEQTIELK